MIITPESTTMRAIGRIKIESEVSSHNYGVVITPLLICRGVPGKSGYGYELADGDTTAVTSRFLPDDKGL